MCNECTSTYDDVITNHAPVCKCRPVECPNSCGANNLQHQHLEEHVSTQCPLSYVDCEFSDAGCDVKVYRKDLSSHMEENMVTHISLLARENRKLVLKLKEQDKRSCDREKRIRDQEERIQEQEGKIRVLTKVNEKFQLHISHVVPVDLVCHVSKIEWFSEPFYTHVGGYKLQLIYRPWDGLYLRSLWSEYDVPLPYTLQITVDIKLHLSDKIKDLSISALEKTLTITHTDEVGLLTYLQREAQWTFCVKKVKIAH